MFYNLGTSQNGQARDNNTNARFSNLTYANLIVLAQV